MKTLVSLNCSSESLEKSLALFYNTLKDNKDFYNKYKIIVFYGDDLPKKKSSIEPVGSIKFYNEISSKIKKIPTITDNYLLKNQKEILLKLLENDYITYRCYKKLLSDKNRYIKFIYKIPYRYINKSFFDKMIYYFEDEYNVKFVYIHLKKDLIKYLIEIGKSKMYHIYGLNYDGIIGKYDCTYNNSDDLLHLTNSLKSNAVLSCNTALLIKIIEINSQKKDVIIGYRQQKKFCRSGQVVALKNIIDKIDCVEEPKNVSYNSYYDQFSDCSPYNINYEVLKKAYVDMLENL